MRTTLIAIALATAGFVAAPLAAHAQEKGGFFINGNVGKANVDDGLYDDDDTGYGVNAGYRWAVSPGFAIGLEGGYQNLGEYSAKSTRLPPAVTAGEAKLKGWTAGVNGHFNVSENWYLSGRGGLFRADLQGDYLVAGVPVRVDDTSNKWYAGAGFGYDFSNNFSVGLNYDYYKAEKNGLKFDPDLVSVSAEYRF
jgi:OOP family OmpA-OmpF porin/outer membrane immunogenic protein